MKAVKLDGTVVEFKKEDTEQYMFWQTHPDTEYFLRMVDNYKFIIANKEYRRISQSSIFNPSLVFHKDEEVRYYAALHSVENLEYLMNDESLRIRIALAYKKYDSKKSAQDKDWQVRKAVAETGREIDKLINDENPLVVAEAIKHLPEEIYLDIEPNKYTINSIVYKSLSSIYK